MLHDGMLALPKIVVCLPQSSVQTSLVTGQGDMFAELFQELAFAAAEGAGIASCAHQNPEDLALDDERREYDRA